jgi:hypothetical protein
MLSKRIVAVAVAAAVLAVPSVAAANSGHGKGKGHEKAARKRATKQERRSSKKKAPKNVSFIFKGIYKGDGVVTVQSGNAHVRKGGFVGQDVTFDLSAAKVLAAEFDGVAGLSAGDLQVGDSVLVQARLPRKTKAPEAAQEGAATEGATTETDEPAAIKARKVIDKTHPKAEEQEQGSEEQEQGSEEQEQGSEEQEHEDGAAPTS